MKSNSVKPEPITAEELRRTLVAYLGIILAFVGIIVAILLAYINHATENFKESFIVIVAKQTEDAAVKIKNSLSEQTEHAASEIRDSLTKQAEQTTSEIKNDLNRQTEQINTKMQELFSDFASVVTLKEKQVNVFKYDLSSSFTVVAIDPEAREVTVQSNIGGELRNQILPIGRTWTVPIPQGHTYTVILTSIDVAQGERTAKFVIAKE
ncbi:MAG: hypothetical protein JW955_26095 [Sedimentisphaerales bacterium]|nr:hypothetical protein [Sedimentisphaerales bacterium]